ncbi:MAG: ATP-dependent RecD-like DNA helicase [Lachnospiraceae bacterium]|nr:ATP-dependent RecD-like DNA helicase [Lachnospiraceae bacterium]
MEQREGYVEHIKYRNADNGYTIFQLSLPGDEEELTCVGSFPIISEGEYLRLTGNMTVHTLYGEQLQVVSAEACIPQDRLAMERYLGSGAIKGVGLTMASRIVRKFGDDTFRIIEREPERLAEIKGISERMAREIFAQFKEKQGMRDAMMYLQKYNISGTLAVKIYKQYGAAMKNILETNPYRMTEDIAGVGFKTADAIAGRIGISGESEDRVRAGILYALQLAAQYGHVYLPEQELYRYCVELLSVSVDSMEHVMTDLAMERKLIIKTYENAQGETERQVYSALSYYTELGVARMLHDLNERDELSEEYFLREMLRIEDGLKISLDETQRKAVYEAAASGVFVLTGGPGTGKTTTINAIIAFFESKGLDILLAAPTGRAAKRMTEATGKEARTMHRLLEVSHMDEESKEFRRGMFNRNEDNPLEADVIIIDEMSMVDVYLMSALLHAVPVGTRLILVGDSNQLPSVGPGNVLRDILMSGCFPSVCLTKIFRQAEESDIIVNAHKINSGESIRLDNKSKDFFMMRRDNPQTIASVVCGLVRDKLPKYVNATPYDIQVLTPMRKGELGVENLNRALQEYLNPYAEGKKQYETRDIVFRVGDKVMQVKNNYQIEWEVLSRRNTVIETGTGIYNGDIGIIKDINHFAEELEILFDDNRTVHYPFSALEDLEHAYAVTIHKSQGSEYPAVVMPILSGPRMLMTRNILYTAVTRAVNCVTIVGSEEQVRQMIANMNEQKRYTGLCERLKEVIVH